MDLDKFCHSTSESMKRPFTRGEYTYATDGHMIVRIPKLDSVEPNEKAPHVENLGWGFDSVERWVDPPLVSPSLLSDCYVCQGTGRQTPCPECFGDGLIEICTDHNSYTVDCKTCDGEGSVMGDAENCSQCKGAGKAGETPIEWERGRVSAILLFKLGELPKVKLGVCGGDLDPIPFRFEGGDGYMMPMSLPGDKK